jgi:tRNA (guanine37-N1)-methyltransferase
MPARAASSPTGSRTGHNEPGRSPGIRSRRVTGQGDRGTSAMDIEVVTIFPEMVEQGARYGVTGRAIDRGIWRLRTWNPRDWASDAYRSIDDRPYGGGPGMVMLAEPLARCLDAIGHRRAADGAAAARVVHLSPQGRPLTQARVAALAAEPALTLLCGRYEAID